MRSMGTRRVALFAGAAAVAAVALAGCSAGQIAETAKKEPSTYGVNVDNADGSVLLRGLAVTYGSPKGYPAGGTAPLEFALFNQTTAPVSVLITSQPANGTHPSQGIVSAQAVGLLGPAPTASTPAGAGGAAPTPASAAPHPSAAPGASAAAGASAVPDASAAPGAFEPQLAKLTIPALGSVKFRPGDARSVQLIGLSAPLMPGNSVNLVFAFSNGVAPLVVQAPVATPLSPAPRGSAEVGEKTGH
ncbi:MAG TPA: hypothetical protein VFO77_04360 [Actinoplanes sp.]|nr:hypothetical protein [Actinoplanes sp.]